MALSIFSLAYILFQRSMDYVEDNANPNCQTEMGEETAMGTRVVSKAESDEEWQSVEEDVSH